MARKLSPASLRSFADYSPRTMVIFSLIFRSNNHGTLRLTICNLHLGIEMTPILRKSKEAAKNVVKTSRRTRVTRPVGVSRFLRTRGGARGGRRLFLTSRSRLASLARSGHLPDQRGPSDYNHRYPTWFNQRDSTYSK